MAMLNYDAEIRPPKTMATKLKNATTNSRQVSMAQTLVREWSEENFDFSEYKDEYREKLEELIDAKLKGRKLVAPEEDKEEPEILNLMDALKKSLSQGRPRKKRSSKKPAKRA